MTSVKQKYCTALKRTICTGGRLPVMPVNVEKELKMSSRADSLIELILREDMCTAGAWVFYFSCVT